MSKVQMTPEALRDYLLENRGRITEVKMVKGRRRAQIVIPARGNKPQKVRTIEVV